MRLKLVLKSGKHNGIVSCIAWNTADEVYSAGDDHALVRWNSLNNETTNVCELPEDVYPIDMHWYPKSQSAGKKQTMDVLVITSADGKFHILNKSGRFEKSVEAHKGAALVGQWSYDGAGLLTAGEDGQVKIWSRSGMLRSTVFQGDMPIYTAVWGADSNQVLFAQGKSLVMKPLAPNTKPNRWRAHEGLILKVAWSQSNHCIVSGGEDCRYKVWDVFGRQLYSSSAGEHPISSLAWAPGGEVFAVGAFNTLRLCDKVGWSHSLDKSETGSIFSLAWSADGTQVAGACGNGQVALAHVVDRRVEWKHLEAVLTSRKTITVRDVLTEAVERLDFPERVAKMALEHAHLVVVTPSHCHVFQTTHWNTPIIIDMKDNISAHLILMSPKHFLLVDRWGMNLYGYEGKLVSSPKFAGMSLEALDAAGISLSSDTLAVLDQNDDKVVHLVDLTAGRQQVSLASMSHTMAVIKVALSETGPPEERELAFIDRNRDLYLCRVRGLKKSKLGVMVQSVAWCSESNILAGLQDSLLTVWFYPAALHMDKLMLRKTNLVKDSSEFGKNPSIVSFVGSLIRMRRADGSMTGYLLPAYYTLLHSFAASTKWDDALRLCRTVNDPVLWACLACMACSAKQLSTAEEAYAASNELDKVEYVQYIRSLPVRAAQTAHMALLAGNTKEAENILLLNGLIFRAIMIHVDRHEWNRALELAVKHRTHVDTVLYKRKCYLESFDKKETNQRFIQYEDQVELDPEQIKEKIKMELAK